MSLAFDRRCLSEKIGEFYFPMRNGRYSDAFFEDGLESLMLSGHGSHFSSSTNGSVFAFKIMWQITYIIKVALTAGARARSGT